MPAFADWTATYDKSSDEDRANALAMDANGNFYCAGFTTTAGAMNLTVVKYSSSGTILWDTTVATALNIRILTVKLNSSGTKLWEKTYSPAAGHLNQGRGVAADSSGKVIVTGYTGAHDTLSSFDFYTAKTTPAIGD